MPEKDYEHIELRRQNSRLLKQLLNVLDQYKELRDWLIQIDSRITNLESMIAQAQDHALRGRKKTSEPTGPSSDSPKD